MKTVGLIGGMSWESTVPYYQTINHEVVDRLGGLHSAKILLDSVDFHEIEALQSAGRWPEAGELLAFSAERLETAGADFLVLCTNTMHKVADRLVACVSIPLLHIADATADAIKSAGLRRIGLLGTRFTMEQDFYRGRLQQRHGLEVIVPSAADRATVHAVIYEELCRGQINPVSRDAYVAIVKKLLHQGCEGVLLGCTEIGLLLKPQDAPVPLFDTAKLHAQAAARFTLDEAGTEPP